MKRWDGWAKAGHIATPEQLQTALGVLRACETQLNAERALARKEGDEAKAAAQSAKAKLQAVNQGKKISDGDVATAAALFEQAGITYEPVASLVQVTDPRWRGPIETFLGPHRLALVVEAGREDKAVDLIRRQRVNNVTVVQPEHLRADIDRAPAPDSVAALLDSTNAVALAYLRRILGRMKRVDSTCCLSHCSSADLSRSFVM